MSCGATSRKAPNCCRLACTLDIIEGSGFVVTWITGRYSFVHIMVKQCDDFDMRGRFPAFENND